MVVKYFYFGRFLWVLSVVFLVNALVLGQTTTISGTGMALNKDAAIEQAKRDAVEKGLGAVIASETIVKNAAVFSDNIFSKAQGVCPILRGNL